MLLFLWQDQEEQAYFAVFDGHGGVDAAIYASIHLHVNLVRQEMFPHDPAEALCRAFRVTDERFVQKAAREVCRFLKNSSCEWLLSSAWFAVKGLFCTFFWSRGQALFKVLFKAIFLTHSIGLL